MQVCRAEGARSHDGTNTPHQARADKAAAVTRGALPRGSWFAAIAITTAISGCVGPLHQWGDETSLVFKAPSFDPSILRREPAAILSAVVGFGLEGYSQQVSRSLSLALSQNEVPLQVVPAYEALSRINRAGLAKEYTDMLAAYVQSGILDHAQLQRVGQAVGASYAFQPSMASFDQSMSGRFSFFGLRVFQTRISMLRLSLQLWDTRTGTIVWEASGEATLANEDVREFRIPFEAIARRLWDRILSDLRLLVKESP